MSANDTQVGGKHYGAPFQHWDFVHEFQLGYFEGQVSRYVTRHRRKKGLEDMEKAVHFTDKMIELHTTSVLPPAHTTEAKPDRLDAYCEANKLDSQESAVMYTLTRWTNVVDLFHLRATILDIIGNYYTPEGEATPAYVKQ